MTCLFSQWVVSNYGQRGGQVEIGVYEIFLENPTVFKVHG